MGSSYKHGMRNMVVIASILLLSACGGAKEETPKPRPTQKAAPKPVAFDPAFVDLAGSWRSAPGSVDGGRYLQIDIASGGGYTIDVRRPNGDSVEVSETGRGKLSLSGARIVSSPSDTQGPFLKRIGAWSGEASKGEDRALSLKGADGTSVTLAWQKL